MISLNHVDMVYPPNQQALRDITLQIRRGEFIFLAGASGAGKSTLLKLLFAEERATRGEVHVADRDLVRIARRDVAALRRRIGVIFQDYRLLPTRTILENVAFALEVVGVSQKARFQLAYKMLSAVGLKNRIHALPMTLSGGEQQRVSIARALVGRPDLILADEPTGNLDPDLTHAIFALLLEANRCGATIIVASHNLPLIEALNRRTLVLDRGKIIGDFARPGG
jgi:cell division transport system ATP-binding protein